ncbi:hypothetical protein OsI_25055 [Oryza sativa Indica Group]|nr:hypothetical protein OsI_25055 [Oryza sativa Indica Group]EEE66645.1 hypothetical protein OsJ_23255 [Oryza sativa Japonica Group]
MGGVVLSDVEASMMEQGKAAVAAMTKTTTQPSQHVRAMPGDPTVDERERFEAMDVIFKLVLTLFVTGVSFGGAVALIVVAFLNADERSNAKPLFQFRGTKLLERKRGAPSSGPSIDDHERAWQSHRALKLQHEQLDTVYARVLAAGRTRLRVPVGVVSPTRLPDHSCAARSELRRERDSGCRPPASRPFSTAATTRLILHAMFECVNTEQRNELSHPTSATDRR